MALAARLWQIDLTTFNDEQAIFLHAAARLLDDHKIPLFGGYAFSIGMRMPPLVTFVLSLPLIVSRNPVWASGCMAVADSMTALCLYLCGRRLGGRRVGFVAGLLYALSPAAIVFGRRIWNTDLVPFFTALALLALIQAWQSRSSRWLAVALLAIGCAIQLHPTTVVLVPLWLVAGGRVGRKRLDWKPLLAAAAVLMVLLAPYAYLQLKTGGADLEAAAQFLRSPKTADLSAVDVSAKLIGGEEYTELMLPAGRTSPAFSLDQAGWLLLALVVLGLVPAWTKRSSGGLLVAAAFLLPILASLRHSGLVYPYYLLHLLPPAMILASFALAALPIRVLGAGLLMIVVTWQAASYVQFQDIIADRGPGTNHGVPLRYEMQAAQEAMAANGGGTLFVSNRGDQAEVFPYLTGYRFPVRQFETSYSYSFIFPRSSAIYLAEADGSYPYRFLSDHFGPPINTVRTTSGLPAFSLFRVPGDAAAGFNASGALTPLQADVGHAAELIGYDASHLAAGQRSPLLLEWRVTDDQAPLGDQVQQFAHLVDRDGKTWSTNHDFNAYRRAWWKTGDVVLSWLDLSPRSDTPRDGYWIETGFYELGKRPLPVFIGGKPAGSSVRFGPVRVDGVSSQPLGLMHPKAVFGAGQVALTGIRVSGSNVELDWYAFRKPQANYTVFVHVLDANGNIIAQQDGPPRDGAFPTTLWEAGDTVRDVHVLNVSSVAVAGAASLEIGLYTRPSLQRLPAFDESGTPIGDRLLLPMSAVSQ